MQTTYSRFSEIILLRITSITRNGKWQLALFSLVHVVILPLLFNTIYRTDYTDTGIYFNYASQVLNGSLPYRDFTLEYPPFALFFFVLPRLLSSNAGLYAVAFQIEVFLFDLLGIVIMYRLAQRQGKAPWKILAVYTISVLAIGPTITQTYDIFPAIIVLLSLYCFWIGKHKTGWIVLALGFMTKVYPIVIVPILLFYYLLNREYKRILSGILIFATTSLATIIPFLVISPNSLFSLINFHIGRGLQLETTYSSFLIILYKLGLLSPLVVHGGSSWNLVSPLADSLAKISFFVMTLLLLLSYWLIFHRMKIERHNLTAIDTGSLLVISVILITSKVLSPQYLIWLLPFLPLLSGNRSYALWVIFVVIGSLTYYVFPLHYTELIRLNSTETIILFTRNIFLIAFTSLVGISLLRSAGVTMTKLLHKHNGIAGLSEPVIKGY